jgi:hypothetical protein
VRHGRQFTLYKCELCARKCARQLTANLIYASERAFIRKCMTALNPICTPACRLNAIGLVTERPSSGARRLGLIDSTSRSSPAALRRLAGLWTLIQTRHGTD